MEARLAHTKSGKEVFRPELDSYEELRELSDDYYGFCTACGNYQEGCEPDAQGYECEECGEPKVYGLEELALMGYVLVRR